MSDGWVKLHRKMTEWEWYKVPNMFHLFAHLVMTANHEDGRWQGNDVKRGQVITGRKSLSEATGISEQSVRTCLSKLELTKEVSVFSTKKYSVITVCNYDIYQEEKKLVNQVLTNSQPTANQVLTTNKNERMKEGKEKRIKDKNFSAIEAKPDFIQEKSWGDLVQHRRIKKAAETERAYTTIVKEIQKAMQFGFTPDDCINKICQRNWTGFEADWMTKNNSARNESKVSLKEQHALELLGNMP